MNKLVVFFIFTFTAMTMLSFMLEGNLGLASTDLTAPISSTATTIPVNSTDGFLASDFIFVNNEIICYSSKTATTFVVTGSPGSGRGCRDTDASSHATNARAYNEATGLINQVAGFNIAQTASTAGPIDVVWKLPKSIVGTFVKSVMWDFSFLTGSGVYIKYLFLYPLSAGFIFALIMATFQAFRGIFGGVF